MGKILKQIKQRKKPLVDRVAHLEQQVFILQHALLDLAGSLSMIAKAAAAEKQQSSQSIVLTDK